MRDSLPNHRSAVLVLAACCMLSATGCETTNKVDGTLGLHGNVALTYRRSCFFGCPLEQPLLVGTHETIRVQQLKGEHVLRAVSTDESVARFGTERSCHCEREDSNSQLAIGEAALCTAPWTKVCETNVQVEAGEAGEATLMLYAGSTYIDQTEVIVRKASNARFYGTPPDAVSETTQDRYALPAGTQLNLRVALYDVRGLELLAPDGVTWQSSAPGIAKVGAFLIGPSAEISAGRDIVVSALAAGRSEIEVEVPSLTVSVDVEVFPAADTAGDAGTLGDSFDDDAGR